MATARSLTPDLYAVLSGTLDSSAVPRILTSFGNASQNNVHDVEDHRFLRGCICLEHFCERPRGGAHDPGPNGADLSLFTHLEPQD
jgi:hypothetical protein